MSISPDTQTTIDHYHQVRTLIGGEDITAMKTLCDWLMEKVSFDDAPSGVSDGFGLLLDIIDPEGIAEQDAGFFDGDDADQ